MSVTGGCPLPAQLPQHQPDLQTILQSGRIPSVRGGWEWQPYRLVANDERHDSPFVHQLLVPAGATYQAARASRPADVTPLAASATADIPLSRQSPED